MKMSNFWNYIEKIVRTVLAILLKIVGKEFSDEDGICT